MDRARLLRALPCYLCGDLPSELAADVRAALEEDPELATLAAQLSASGTLCKDRLRRAAPGALFTVRRAALVERPASALWAGLVAVVLVVSFVLATANGPDRRAEDDVRALLQAPSPVAAPLITASSPAALTAALRDAQISPLFTITPSLEAAGLTLEGASPAFGGCLVVYRDARGARLGVLRVPEQGVNLGGYKALKSGRGPALRAHGEGAGRVVAHHVDARADLYLGPWTDDALFLASGLAVAAP
ncbi:hypothetical protein L6R49_31035 [Myxococcota bacterium]|nr:hypothetical protein [Myxococcota bacterium]